MLAVNSLDDREGFQRQFDITVCITGCLVALFGLKQAIFPGWLNPEYLSQGKMGIYSTIGNANYLAFYLLYSSIISFGLYERTTRPAARILVAAGFVLQASCFLSTYSRSSYTAAAACICVIFYHRGLLPAYGKNLLKVIAVFLVAAGAAVAVLNIPWLKDRLLSLHSMQGRRLIWMTAASMITDHPLFGVGLGQFELNYIPYQGTLFLSGDLGKYMYNASLASYAHCEPLHFWAETGFLGFLALILLAVLGLRQGIGASKDQYRRWHWYGLVALLLVGLYNNFLQVAPLAILFWTSLGLVVKRGREEASVTPGAARSSVAAGFIVLSALLAVRLFMVGLSNRYERINDILGEQGRYKEAAGYAEAAVRHNPFNGYAREKYALSLHLSGRSGPAFGQLDTAAMYSGDIGIPYLKAEILAQRGEDDRAIALYRRIATAFPSHLTPHLMLAQLYLRQGDWRMARYEFRRVLDIKPSHQNLKMDWSKIRAQRDIARYFLNCGP